MHVQVAIDIVGGQAYAGDAAVAIAAADAVWPGALRFEDGLVIRPLTFGERLRMVRHAATTGSPADTLAQAVLAAATVEAALTEPDATTRTVQEILALTLAGADQEGPPFVDTMLALARGAHWTPDQIDRGEAAALDLIAQRLTPDPADDGWMRIAFEAPAELSTTALRRQLALNLLKRLDVSVPLAEREPAKEQEAFGPPPELSHLPSFGAGIALPETDSSGRTERTVPVASPSSPRPWAVGEEKVQADPAVQKTQIPVGAPAGHGTGIRPVKARLLGTRPESKSSPAPEAVLARVLPRRQTADGPVQIGATTAALPAPSGSTPPASFHLPKQALVRHRLPAGDGLPVPAPVVRTWETSLPEVIEAHHAWPQHQLASCVQIAPEQPQEPFALFDPFDVADELARLLHEEADLRGLDL